MKIQKPADAAKLIKTCRLEQGLTQQSVADAVDVTRQSFARIEQGHGGASLETFLKIFTALDITLHGTPATHDSSAVAGDTATPDDTEQERQTLSSNVYAGILRNLGNAASLAATRDLVDSGAVAKSILRMNQTVLDRLSNTDQDLLKDARSTLSKDADGADSDDATA